MIYLLAGRANEIAILYLYLLSTSAVFELMSSQRHLAAILFTDIVGYTAMMQKHEAEAVSIIKHYHEVLEGLVVAHHGEILNNYGDGSLCSFRSAMDALHCALELQRDLRSAPSVPLRIGLHIGEILFENGKVLGDAVNIASRIQSLGIANSILISSDIQSKLKNQPEFKTISLGSFQFKNVDDKIEVFALANEGLVIPHKNKLEGKLQPARRSANFWLIVFGLLLLTITGFFVLQKMNRPVEMSVNSIAVLPFENLTNDPELEVFCDGITDEILNHLAKVGSLSVTSRTSVKSYKGTKLPIKEIALKLGVSHILEGSVRKSGDQVRITTQLIDATTDKHIWSDDYDYRELKDIFPIQSDVSTRVTEVLKLKLTKQEKESLSKKYTENVRAYTYYLKGRKFWDKRTKESYDSAEANFRKAINLDPHYALAYSGLADCYTFNQIGLTQVQAVPIAQAYAEKALQLDSNLCEALTTIGFIQSHYEYHWEEGKKTLRKALLCNPNYESAHRYLGNIFLFNRDPKGYDETKTALDLDPLSASVNWVMARYYYYTGKYDSCIAQLLKNQNLNPNYKLNKTYLALSYLKTRQYNKALDVINNSNFPTLLAGEENKESYLGYLYAVTGKRQKAEEELHTSIEKYGETSAYRIAQLQLALGYTEKALESLEKAYNLREITLIFINVEPDFERLRNHPRFKALLKKMNF